jgi:hypothetical protein
MNVTNPYKETIEMMKRQGASVNPPVIQLGKIESVNPLVVSSGDLTLYEYNLKVNYLLLDHEREFTLENTTASGSIGNVSIENGKIKIKTCLKIGDEVALQQISETTFLLLSKF